MNFIRKNKNNTYTVIIQLDDKVIDLGSYKKKDEATDLSELALDIVNDDDVSSSMCQYNLIIPNIIRDKTESQKALNKMKRIYKLFIEKKYWSDYGL